MLAKDVRTVFAGKKRDSSAAPDLSKFNPATCYLLNAYLKNKSAGNEEAAA